jgi:hypothetical protein
MNEITHRAVNWKMKQSAAAQLTLTQTAHQREKQTDSQMIMTNFQCTQGTKKSVKYSLVTNATIQDTFNSHTKQIT